MKIGDVNICGDVFLAPMAGITDASFRSICRSYGAALTYTEMISAKALHYKDRKTHELMKVHDDDHPCAVQIFGSDAEIMAEVVPEVIGCGTDIIDINMGCPMQKIVSNGDGSALMKNPEEIGKIVRAVVKASSVPVTVKIRSGWDESSINAVEIAKICEGNGAAAIAVHGRTKNQYYSGIADRGIIRDVVENVKIPVIGSGDIFKPYDVRSMFEETGCAAVMIARGARGDPFIFTQANELLDCGEIKTFPTPTQKIECAIKQIEMMYGEKGEKRAVAEARKHIAWYLKGLPGSAEIKRKVFAISDFATLVCVLRNFICQLQ